MRGSTKAGTLYVRVPADLLARVHDRAAADSRKVSDECRELLDRGLRHDPAALHALLSACWSVCGYLQAGNLEDREHAQTLTGAVRRAEAALGLTGNGSEG